MTLVSALFRPFCSCFVPLTLLNKYNICYVHYRKIYYSIALAAKKHRKAHQRLTFLSVSKARTNKFPTMYVYCLYTLPRYSFPDN